MTEPKVPRGSKTPLISTAIEIAAEGSMEVAKPEQLMTEMTEAFGDISVSSITEIKATYANVVKIRDSRRSH